MNSSLLEELEGTKADFRALRAWVRRATAYTVIAIVSTGVATTGFLLWQGWAVQASSSTPLVIVLTPAQ